MQFTNLSGFSGCKILLCEDEDETFVRKISGNVEYNDRLKIQMDKQNEYRSELVFSPRVLDCGYENGLFYFDMEYLQGITLAEKLKTMRIDDIHKYVDILTATLMQSEMKENLNANEIFSAKISQVESKLKTDESELWEKAIIVLKNHDWGNLPSSTCHGDLTLENIMIHDGKLFFIDFLDSFYDSWVLDMATMLQDAQCLWSFRNETKINNNTLVRMMIFNDLLLDGIRKKQENIVCDIYYALLLKLFRIVPYCTDIATRDFIHNKVNVVISLIEREEK